MNGMAAERKCQLFGLIAMEMARVDSSIATFLACTTLSMGSHLSGRFRRTKQKWLPPMARWENWLLRLDSLSSALEASGGLTTTAKRDGDAWILNGQKNWIGNSPWCDISIIWGVISPTTKSRHLIVEKQTHTGFTSKKIQNKIRS